MSKHILIVDDEAEIRELVALALSDRGYRCTPAPTARDARRIMQAGGVDLVICDLQLDDADGLQLLGEFRAARPALPTILLTGVLFEPSVVDSNLSGVVSSYVPKPSKLLHVVEEARRLLGDTPTGQPAA